MSKATEHQNISELYATALLELAEARGVAQALDQELSEFVVYLKIESDFRGFFESRIIDTQSRQQSLERMFRGKMSDLLLNTLQILNHRGRTAAVVYIQQIYHELYLAAQGIVAGQVTTAEPLTESSRARVQQLLDQYTGKRVNIVEHVDPDIIGGLIISVGDERADASVSSQLRRFHDMILDHASRNIHSGSEKFFEGRVAE